jgi:hypothetical protein
MKRFGEKRRSQVLHTNLITGPSRNQLAMTIIPSRVLCFVLDLPSDKYEPHDHIHHTTSH